MDGWLTGLAAGVQGAESGIEKALARKQKEQEDLRKQKLEKAQMGHLSAESGHLGAQTGFLQEQTKLLGPKTMAEIAKLYSESGKSGEKPLTESQAKAAAFQEQMKTAEDLMNEQVKKGYDPTAIRTKFTGILPSMFQSPKQQIYNKASEARAAKQGYFESGANVTPTEFARNVSLYSDTPGSSPELSEAKSRLRQSAMSGIGKATGRLSPDGSLSTVNQLISVPPISAPSSAQAAPPASTIKPGQVIVNGGNTWIKLPNGYFQEQ